MTSSTKTAPHGLAGSSSGASTGASSDPSGNSSAAANAQPKSGPKSNQDLQANFSTLVLSIGSSAAMALGLAPNPQNGKMEKDKELARFNIDLLRMLREKTKGNLSSDEQRFVDSVITDLQVKYVND